jgi:hypothetical protein
MMIQSGDLVRLHRAEAMLVTNLASKLRLMWPSAPTRGAILNAPERVLEFKERVEGFGLLRIGGAGR